MKYQTFTVAIALAITSSFPGLVHAEPFDATLTDSQVLLTDYSLSRAKLASCQPMKGERVTVIETKMDIDGMTGVSAARVIVLEGNCKDKQGWVGLTRLERATYRGG